MTAGRTDRRPVKIRRRGRHSSPSQVEKVAQQAGRAAPAVAIAGVLVAAPQTQNALAQSHQAATVSAPTTPSSTKATLDAFETHSVTVASSQTGRHTAAATGTNYRVRSGDTLSRIADRFYHKASDWQYLYHENQKTISNPNRIYVGESIFVPATAPAHYALTDYVPRHAKTAAPRSSGGGTGGGHSTGGHSTGGHSTGGGHRGTVVVQTAAQGHYSCSGLEQLWEQAGGSPARAFMAAEIAMAESGGNPNAISPTNDYGLWQINGSNGSLATLNPSANARSAVIMSNNGTNWHPWTTYTSGAYSGKC
jgi:LysM repeat protein